MLNKLNEREKLALLGFIVFIIFITVGYIVFKIYSIRVELTDSIQQARTDLTEIDSIISKHNYYRNIKSTQALDVSTIYSKLDVILIRYGLKGDRTTLNDFPETVIQKEYSKLTFEIKMRSVKLTDVFKMIYDIEVNKEIDCKVDSLSFYKPLPGKEEYDVVFKISSYSRKKK
jgi:general secretion pathway protein M